MADWQRVPLSALPDAVVHRIADKVATFGFRGSKGVWAVHTAAPEGVDALSRTQHEWLRAEDLRERLKNKVSDDREYAALACHPACRFKLASQPARRVLARRDIPAGTYVTLYPGTLRAKAAAGSSDGTYCIDYTKQINHVLLGDPSGKNLGPLLNAPDNSTPACHRDCRSCEAYSKRSANTVPVLILRKAGPDDAEALVAARTIHAVRADAELLMDYGSGYFPAHLRLHEMPDVLRAGFDWLLERYCTADWDPGRARRLLQAERLREHAGPEARWALRQVRLLERMWDGDAETAHFLVCAAVYVLRAPDTHVRYPETIDETMINLMLSQKEARQEDLHGKAGAWYEAIRAVWRAVRFCVGLDFWDALAPLPPRRAWRPCTEALAAANASEPKPKPKPKPKRKPENEPAPKRAPKRKREAEAEAERPVIAPLLRMLASAAESRARSPDAPTRLHLLAATALALAPGPEAPGPEAPAPTPGPEAPAPTPGLEARPPTPELDPRLAAIRLLH